MLLLNSLLITQEVIRDQKQLTGMLCFVRKGGYWTMDALKQHAQVFGRREPQPIYITRFPDGVKIIHDGHHRCVSTLAGGRDYLREDEYILKDWEYKDYDRIKIAGEGLKTPFKQRALEVWKENPDALEEFVYLNRHEYVRPRTMSSVAELMETCAELRGGAAGKILCG